MTSFMLYTYTQAAIHILPVEVKFWATREMLKFLTVYS
jgi:hypothetical protein